MKPETDFQILVQVPARLKLQFVLQMFKVENTRIPTYPIRVVGDFRSLMAGKPLYLSTFQNYTLIIDKKAQPWNLRSSKVFFTFGMNSNFHKSETVPINQFWSNTTPGSTELTFSWKRLCYPF